MSELRVLTAHGDQAVRWDRLQAQQRDPAALAAVREAERIFEAQRKRGATAFRVEGDARARRLDAFDPAAERIVVVPRVAGG